MAEETFYVEPKMACEGRGAALRCPCGEHVSARYNQWLAWQER